MRAPRVSTRVLIYAYVRVPPGECTCARSRVNAQVRLFICMLVGLFLTNNPSLIVADIWPYVMSLRYLHFLCIK